jgi:hypothetical protein
MNNNDEMVFEKDSLHGLEEPKDKTKTQEDTGDHSGYYGSNRKERDQAQRVLETRQQTEIDTNKDRNWKVVGRKSSTPLRKAVMLGAVERNEGYDKVAVTVCDKGLYNTVGTVRDKVLVPGSLVPGNSYNLWISIGVNDKHMDTFESQNSIIG